MSEPIATLYIEFGRVLYRFKIFRDSIGLERQQPQSANQLYSKIENPDADLLYNVDTETWNIDAMIRLIDEYEIETLGDI